MGYVASAVGTSAAAIAAAQQLLGITDKQLESIKQLLPFYTKDHVIIPLSKPKNGKVEHVDMSYMNPYDYALTPMRKAINTYQKSGKLGDSEVEQILRSAWDGLWLSLIHI